MKTIGEIHPRAPLKVGIKKRISAGGRGKALNRSLVTMAFTWGVEGLVLVKSPACRRTSPWGREPSASCLLWVSEISTKEIGMLNELRVRNSLDS